MDYRLQAITVKEALRLVENIGTTFKFRSGRVNTPGDPHRTRARTTTECGPNTGVSASETKSVGFCMWLCA